MFQNHDNIYEYFSAKQGQRHGHDSAIVNAAGGFVVDKKTMIVKETRFAFGGVSNRPYMVCVNQEYDIRYTVVLLELGSDVGKVYKIYLTLS